MTKKELFDIFKKPESECDGYELHIRQLWIDREYGQIFSITGIDLNEVYREKLRLMYSEDEMKMLKEFYDKHQKNMLYGSD